MYLLNYKDALRISEKYNNSRSASNFWESTFRKDGYKLSTFNYFICGWNDFSNPLMDDSGITAFDMRGTTFVFNEDGTLWKRFLMLPKFFNLNQVEFTQYDLIKNKKIKSISAKEDGSLVAFMMLPNGNLFSKTIGSFVSEQAEQAYRFLYRWEEKVIFVKWCLNAGFTPLFEYVSGPNRIVLKYSHEDLRFLGLRDNGSGEWIPWNLLKKKEKIPFNTPKDLSNLSLENLIEKSSKEEDIEGWVVLFEDGQLIKIKTEWYFKMHGLRTENIFREDYVIKNYLEQTLDDITCQLDKEEDSDAFEFIEKVTKSIDNYIHHIDNMVQKLVVKYETEYKSQWHYFAKFNNKESYFGLSRSFIETPEKYNSKKIDMILRKTYRLKSAKELIERWQNKQ
jgi:T4 RnlA family RNA ligase